MMKSHQVILPTGSRFAPVARKGRKPRVVYAVPGLFFWGRPRLLREIRRHVSRSLYREVMAEMYGRMRSTRKRALASRRLEILETLLRRDRTMGCRRIDGHTRRQLLKSFIVVESICSGPESALCSRGHQRGEARQAAPGKRSFSEFEVSARLEWPMEITETNFYAQVNKMPQAKTLHLLASWH